MAENYQPNVGELCHEGARRDAVHFALAPVVAKYHLLPGSHVGLTEEGTAYWTDEDEGSARTSKTIGIVDPFLEKWVKPGEKFWLFLYPGTITGLRHSWSHPAFKPKIPEVKS